MSLLSSVGVLAVDLDALHLAAEVAARSLAPMPGLGAGITVAQHQWSVVTAARTSMVDPQLTIGYLTPGALWFACRQAIDAGEPEFALAAVREQAGDSSHGRAARAIIEGATTSDDDRWHEALRIAADHGLRLIATDALEALAVSAARAESWIECLRLLGSAQRLRDETGYRWRFRFEREVLEPARAAAVAALGDRAEEVLAAEPLAWRDAAAYASRARGQRKRPRHGWPSLTPTERQIVALVAEGCTNPQIAERC